MNVQFWPCYLSLYNANAVKFPVTIMRRMWRNSCQLSRLVPNTHLLEVTSSSYQHCIQFYRHVPCICRWNLETSMRLLLFYPTLPDDYSLILKLQFAKSRFLRWIYLPGAVLNLHSSTHLIMNTWRDQFCLLGYMPIVSYTLFIWIIHCLHVSLGIIL